MHRFRNQCSAIRHLYTTKAQEIQVQSLETGCFDSVRLFYHVAHRFEYNPLDDEGT